MKNEKIRVTKSFTFDMGHALMGYDGPCKEIHGHTYHLYVTLLGRPMDQQGNPKDGMVVDFGWIKKAVKEKVIARYDHALVMNSSMSKEHQRALSMVTEKLEFVDFQPSCENLLLHFKNILKAAFAGSGLELVSMKLYETPTSYAEWLASDQI